jgi:hypothetical protein
MKRLTLGRTLPRFQLTPHSRFDAYEFDACRVGKAEERTCPDRGRSFVRDFCTDQERNGVAVAEDKLSMQDVHPHAEAEWHMQASFRAGDWQKRQLPDIGL